MKRGIKIPKRRAKPPRPASPEDTVLDSRDDFVIGDRVVFGRKSNDAEQTLGRVVKVNAKSIKVEQLEPRGRTKAHPVGTVWTVDKALCRVVNDEEAVPVQMGVTGQQRAINNRHPVTGMPVNDAPVACDEDDTLTWHILSAIWHAYWHLDDAFDAPTDNKLAWKRMENARLRHLCRALGRHVTKAQINEWHDAAQAVPA